MDEKNPRKKSVEKFSKVVTVSSPLSSLLTDIVASPSDGAPQAVPAAKNYRPL